ncbi:MAG: potassium transporter Kup [Verrucomicrobiota bacterium]
MTADSSGQRRFLGLILGALGVVYGDIGTSPLYAFRECFHGPHAIDVSHANVLGVLSLVVWSLILIVSVKYLLFVMRANNKGEGGILALLSLAFPERTSTRKSDLAFIALGVFGAALLYGDGIITPAISVLSAVEGLKVATPFFEPFILPITIGILVGLFSVQKAGTGRVGKIFGPVTLLWFLTLALLGIKGIVTAPEVLKAVNPLHGLEFFLRNGARGFVVLGSVFLVVTGAEALYADMGHFGVRPIRFAWFFVVLPALLLNYFGQGALLWNQPAAAENPFYRLAPGWLLYPLVILATMATVIASQALISGSYSLTMQAIQLGYFPRLEIDHTSHAERGQIYMPHVNWTLMIACVGLVLGFQSSSNLAAAYGIAVTLTMVITTLLFYFAAMRLWKWPKWLAATVCCLFLIAEVAFFLANALKFLHGGWFPIVVGVIIFTLMTTWKTGRALLRKKLQASTLPFKTFFDSIRAHPPTRVKGTAVYMAGNPTGTPVALLHNLKHNKVMHERVVVLTLATAEVPHVDTAERVKVERLDEGVFRVIARYGFMEEPNVPEVLELCKAHALEFKPLETTFFLSRETIIATHTPGMAIWREKLFAIMSRNAQTPTAFFRLPANRVVELGMQVEL